MKTLTTISSAFALAIVLCACGTKQPSSHPAAAAREARVVCQQYTNLQPLGTRQETKKTDTPAQACVAVR